MKAATVAEHFQWQVPQTAAAWGELPGLWQADLGILQEKVRELEATVALAQAAEKVAEQAFYRGEELQRAFAEQEDLAIQAKELAEQTPKIVANKERIARLTWAQANQHLLREYDQSQVALADYEKQAARSADRLKSLASQKKAWEAEKLTIAKVETRLARQRKELAQKELLLPVAQQYEQLVGELTVVNQNLAQLAKDQADLADQQANLDKEQEKLAVLLDGETVLQKEQLQLAQLTAHKERLLQLTQQQTELSQEIVAKQTASDSQGQKAQKLTAAAAAAKRNFYKQSQQASLMIAKLCARFIARGALSGLRLREISAHQQVELPPVDIAENEARLTQLESKWQAESQASALAMGEVTRLEREVALLEERQAQVAAACQQLLMQFVAELAPLPNNVPRKAESPGLISAITGKSGS